MISSLKGKIQVKNGNHVVIEVHDIGYRVFVGERTSSQFNEGEQATLHTHQYLRETASELYGFLTHQEVDFFKKLIDLPSVGPKSALNIMDISSLPEILSAIQNQDSKLLTKASGIGQRTAERIVVELKDKLDFTLPKDIQAPTGDKAEAIEALEGLGFSVAEAREALRQVPADVKDTEDIVKAALKGKERT